MIDLDHVAIATTDIEATLGTLVGELGGTVFHGGNGYGFRWVQVRLGTPDAGMTVEVLVVWEPAVNDFLERFVARHGPRQHHLTFKTKDIAATLERVRSAGFQPVGVDLRDPEWKEAFLQPREAHGTVVQLAEVGGDHPTPAAMVEAALTSGAPYGEPTWWPAPPPAAADAVTLRRVVLATPSLTAAVSFFAGLLEGVVVEEDDAAVELAWPGGGRARLELDPGTTPGVVRLEGERAGTPVEVDVSGVRFALSRR